MKALGFLFIFLAVVLGVVGVALMITIIGIIPGLGFVVIGGLLLIYGIAGARGEPMRGALSRRRARRA